MSWYNKGDIVLFGDETTTTLKANTFLTIGNFYLGKKIKDVKSHSIENGERHIIPEPKGEPYTPNKSKSKSESDWDDWESPIPLNQRKPGYGIDNPDQIHLNPLLKGGGGVNVDALRNPNATSVGKRIVAGVNLKNNYAYN